MKSRILIVQDDIAFLDSLQKYLSEEGLNVEITNDSLKALDMLEKKQFDILVTDIRMPLFSGIDLIRSARESQPDLPVVILSGEGTLSEAIEAVNLHVFRYLQLPLKDNSVLKDVVQDIFRMEQSHPLQDGSKQEEELLFYQRIISEIYRLPRFGNIATGIAHNINSPLGGVIGYAQLAMMKNPQVKGLDMINQQAVKISQLLAGISEKGQSEIFWTVSDIDLASLVDKELDYLNFNLYFKHQIEKNLKLKKVPHFKGIYAHWSQILHHLIQNAQDAMFESPEKTLSITTDCENDIVILKVADTGEGIPPDDLPRIFLPGFSTRQFPSDAKEPDEPQGYGLGLFVVKNLLEEYDADITVQSEPGKGSEITIKIPIHAKRKKFK